MGNPKTLQPKPFTSEYQPAKRGSRKGIPNRSTLLRKWANVKADVTNPITKEKEKGTVEDLAELAFINKVLKGDVNAYKEFKDTLYGKIPDKSEVAFEGEVQHNVTHSILEKVKKIYSGKKDDAAG